VTGQATPPTTPPSGPPSEQGPPSAPQKPPAKAPPLAPVAERKELAQTGLNPGLIAFAGLLCLGGGAFLFRRALARD
jgi:LPXTG-motif cell wall-anchored protein